MSRHNNSNPTKWNSNKRYFHIHAKGEKRNALFMATSLFVSCQLAVNDRKTAPLVYANRQLSANAYSFAAAAAAAAAFFHLDLIYY